MAKGISLPNVYENLKEAHLRLRHTIVMYENMPYTVLAITNHKEDGIFRVYLQSLVWDGRSQRPYPPCLHSVGTEAPELGPALDLYLETAEGKKSEIVRKRIDSKHFNNFRPFPMGMVNTYEYVTYIEWSPLRATHQGLTSAAMVQTNISLNYNKMQGIPRHHHQVEVNEPAFGECLRGEYPEARDVLAHLKTPNSRNEAYAFDRKFAIVKGPLGMLFLAYKTDIIGYMPNMDFSALTLGREFGYCKEVVNELRVFNRVN